MGYGKKGAERPVVEQWLRKWRTDGPHDLVLKDFPFKKIEPMAYGWSYGSHHKADLMVVGSKLIAVVFIHNLHYAFVEDWKERQKQFTFFDEVWVCVTTRNFANLYNNTHKDIGIFIANGTQTLAVVRYPNLRVVSSKHKAELAMLLSTTQIKSLLDRLGVKYVKKSDKPRLVKYASEVDYEDLKSAVVKSIKDKSSKKTKS